MATTCDLIVVGPRVVADTVAYRVRQAGRTATQRTAPRWTGNPLHAWRERVEKRHVVAAEI